MSSIRRSLTLYFLVLLGLGLGAVALLTDRVVGQTLEARQRAATALIEARYDERRREADRKLNDTLLNDARVLYSQMQSQYAFRFDQEGRKFRTTVQFTESLFAAVAPLGRIEWHIGAYRGPFYYFAAKSYFDHLSLDDAALPSEHEAELDAPAALSQINIASRTGSIWRSKSMGKATFPTDLSGLAANKVFDWSHDSQVINGEPVRRVLFKGPFIAPWGGRVSIRSSGPGSGRGREGGPPPGSQGPPPPPNPQLPPSPDRVFEAFPRIFVHCARPMSGLESEYAQLAVERDRQVAELAASVESDRVQLRWWLAGIGMATFFAIVIGGPVMIARGLAPLRTLSDAVSRVSEKDFRLPVERARMSLELVPIHERLSDTLDALRRAFEREKQAVADISHELRTPVAALLTTLDVSLRKQRTADQYRTTLEESRVISRQLAQLVERVMTLAWLDAGNDQVKPVSTDAIEVATACAAVIRPLAESQGLTFSADLPASLPMMTDPDKLREVVVNLLHNAVEYNRPGGTIRLAVHQNGAGSAAIEVADTGIGMATEVREKIFERFFRADDSRHAAGVHAGLGLSIVKEYVERLGGTITVESVPNVGSTFRVTLPLAC